MEQYVEPQYRVRERNHEIHGPVYEIDIFDRDGNIVFTVYGVTSTKAVYRALWLETVLWNR